MKFVILCLGPHFIPKNILTPSTDLFPQLTEISLLFQKGSRKKVQLGSLTSLGKLFLLWSPVKRKQKAKKQTDNNKKRANIGNLAYFFFISKGLKILWNY